MEQSWVDERLEEARADMPQLAGQRLQVLAIDDDVEFLELLRTTMNHSLFQLDCFESLPHVGNVSQLGQYDLAILDFYLPQVNGLEIAEYVDAFFKEVPVILISGGKPDPNAHTVWPQCIKKYVDKSEGIHALLDAVLEVAASRSFS